MTSPASYVEYRVPFAGDELTAAVRLATTAGYPDYLLYESADEWSLGLGIHARMTVYEKTTHLHCGEREQVWDNSSDLSQSIATAMSQVDVRGWRAYGTVDFELSRTLYGLDQRDGETPLCTMFVPEAEVRIGAGSVLLRALGGDALDALRRCLEPIIDEHDPSSADFAERTNAPRPALDEIRTHDAERYKRNVETALGDMAAMRYRKVILSRRVPIPHEVDMTASFVAGRRANTPARSYLLRLDGLEVAGFSPETVVEVNDQRELFTTPLAGTRAIGSDLAQELRLREELLSDTKEIAEHAISVYVGFDEMTMVCDPREVSVVNFMIVARRGSVQHLASRLRGKLLEHSNAWHALFALFPGVTASGVPKQASIEAIGRLEPQPRGLYAGCVVIHDESGTLDAALVLRSIYQRDRQAWLQAGAGIMNMSTPERELEETREKLLSCAEYIVPAQR